VAVIDVHQSPNDDNCGGDPTFSKNITLSGAESFCFVGFTDDDDKVINSIRVTPDPDGDTFYSIQFYDKPKCPQSAAGPQIEHSNGTCITPGPGKNAKSAAIAVNVRPQSEYN
jgi:hypothetical protein